MKKPVMQREMFIAMAPKSGSKGILSGFDEEMEIDNYEDRTPENLEIIANNLRGDIRSMDERYLELAQLVGESAFDTPEEVIALMQSQMGQQPQQGATPAPSQQPGGIAALGGATAPQAPQGIMQGVAGPTDQGPMPGMEQMPQPVQMAHGGIVHRQLGSPPTGEVAPGRRALGFMRFMEPGSIPDPRTMDPRSVPLPKVQLQQTPSMAPSAINAIRYGDVSPQASQFLQSGASRLGTLPQQIPLTTRLSTSLYEGMRAAPGFAREVGRTMMSTPQGRAAAVIGTGVTAALPFLGGREQAPSDQPAVSEVPGVDAQGRYTPVPLPMPVRGKTGDVERDIGEPPMRGKTGIPGLDVGGEEPAVPAVTAPTVTAPTVTAPTVAEKIAAPAPKPRDFKGRVEDKIAIYKDVLGDDKNMRQAQALFLLAEAALNVAGASGRSTAERLAKGLKGLPAGMGALGAEQAKQDLAIRSAAVSSVEQEMAAESKQATQLMLKMADLNAKNADINTMAQYLVDSANFSPDKAVQVAKLSKAGAIKTNEAGEMVDFTGRVINSPYRLTDGDVGFLPADGSMPFVSVGKRSLVPATAKDRPALATELANNQSMVGAIERVMQLPAFESMFGPLAKVQSGLTSVITPFFGADAPFTNLPKDVQKNIAMEFRNELIQLNARNTSRPSVWEQKQVEKFINDPNAILTSPEEFFGILNNFRVKAINRANEIEHQLTGAPLKQLEYIPLGTAKDPLQAKDTAYLGEFFRLRPSASIFIQLPNEKSPRKLTAQEYFKQIGQQ